MNEENKKFNVFHRTWWKENPAFPDGLEPQLGKRHEIAKGVSYAAARLICKEYNTENAPGRLSDKAEFEEAKD